jgi:hypothetical protein
MRSYINVFIYYSIANYMSISFRMGDIVQYTWYDCTHLKHRDQNLPAVIGNYGIEYWDHGELLYRIKINRIMNRILKSILKIN